jgi:hypothetical protein
MGDFFAGTPAKAADYSFKEHARPVQGTFREHIRSMMPIQGTFREHDSAQNTKIIAFLLITEPSGIIHDKRNATRGEIRDQICVSKSEYQLPLATFECSYNECSGDSKDMS